MLSLPILCIIRSIMSCKVTGKTNPQIKLFNLDALFYHFAFIIKIHYTFLIKYIIFLSLICIALWFTITTLFFLLHTFQLLFFFVFLNFPFFTFHFGLELRFPNFGIYVALICTFCLWATFCFDSCRVETVFICLYPNATFVRKRTSEFRQTVYKWLV